MKTIIEVGANNGSDTERFASLEDSRVIAFEPVPAEISHSSRALLGLCQRRPNITWVKKAVSDFNGRAKFNISAISGWGCSSLLEFKNDILKHWPNRFDIAKTGEIDVEVTRLDTYLDEIGGLDSIDHIHIDAQGADLKVLQSLGKYLALVKQGCVEAAKTSEVAIYHNQHTIQDVKDFLESNDFIIQEIKGNDGEGNEFNIYFSKK